MERLGGNRAGAQIRARRQARGLGQGALARQVGISPSYLNLIEHDRRRIGGKLLVALAAALDADPADLAPGRETPRSNALRLAAASAAGADGTAADPPPELDRLDAFAGGFPGWAALVVRQRDRILAHRETIGALSDRLAHDPFLADTMHEVLNTASAIRATASILARTPDLEPARRGRFHTNLFQDSQRLAETIGALVAWLDRSAAPGAAEATPADALAAFVAAQDNHFPQIEAGADPETLIAADPRLPDAAARGLARAWLDRMAADARALPLAAFGAAAARLGADPLALAARFGAPLDRVLRRLASLPAQPGLAEHGLVLCDGSGMPTLRKPLPGFPVPRYGAGCPLWPLYQALLRPGVPVAAVVALPDGGRFVAHAICALDRPEAVGGPQRAEATMALRRVVDGGAGLGAPGALPIFEAGPGCRICPRSSCTARREPAMV